MPAEKVPAEHWPAAAPAISTAAAPAVVPGAADYDAICAAVMETERGRWFLAEYARRNRQADTAQVLAAIDGLMARVRAGTAIPRPESPARNESSADMDRLRAELADMANAIARTKTEIASIRPDAAQGGRILEATEQLDSVVRTIERATSDILAAAEQVQETAWTMREQGMESEFCDRLDSYATDIYTACSFQDLTGQRTRKIIHVLRYLEARILAMTSIWGAAAKETEPAADQVAGEAAAPVPDQVAPSDALVQTDVDRMMTPAAPVLVEPLAVQVPVTALAAPIAQSPGVADADAGHTADPVIVAASPLGERDAVPDVALEAAGRELAQAAALPAQSPEDVPPALAQAEAASDGEQIKLPVHPPTPADGDAPAPTSRTLATSTVSADDAKSVLTIEGPTGSYSILSGRAVEPEEPQTAEVPVAAALPVVAAAPMLPAAPTAATSPIEQDPVVANLRAFAANLMAEFGRDPAAPATRTDAPPDTAITPPVARADIAPATGALAAPPPVTVEPPPVRQDELVLPRAAAPKLGDTPQRPAPEPAPRRKSDIAENLFADVMALTDEERIALFT
jgi:chemotaxis protein CheZ